MQSGHVVTARMLRGMGQKQALTTRETQYRSFNQVKHVTF